MESVTVFPKAAQLCGPGISAIRDQKALFLGQSAVDKKKQETHHSLICNLSMIRGKTPNGALVATVMESSDCKAMHLQNAE